MAPAVSKSAAPLAFWPDLPPNKMYFLGNEGSSVVWTHRSARPLYARGKNVRPGTPLRVREWSDIPHYIFKNTPPAGYRAQIYRDGTRVRVFIGKDAAGNNRWRESEGYLPYLKTLFDGSIIRTGRRVFELNEQSVLASRLMAFAYFDMSPRIDSMALHVNRVDERAAPSDDSARNILWGTANENAADKAADGQYGTIEGLKLAILGRPNTNEATPADQSGIVFDVVDAEGFMWARFESASDAAKSTPANQADISKVLRGEPRNAEGAPRNKTAGGWRWKWDVPPRPAAENLAYLDESQLGTRYVSRDGRLFVEKPSPNGTVLVLLTLKAQPGGSIKFEVNKKAAYEEIRGQQTLHRVIAFLFLRAELEAKIKLVKASTDKTVSFATLEVDHKFSDRTDNRAQSLQFLTRAEHNAKTHGQLVIETLEANPASKHLNLFATSTKAAASAGMSKRALYAKFKAGNGSATVTHEDGSTRYFFLAPDEFPVIETLEEDRESEEIARFTSIAEAAESAGVKRQALSVAFDANNNFVKITYKSGKPARYFHRRGVNGDNEDSDSEAVSGGGAAAADSDDDMDVAHEIGVCFSPSCTHCESAAARCCSLCGTPYCSTACQRANWSAHASVCMQYLLRSK